MKQVFKIGLSALVGISMLATGCVREDLSGCPPPKREVRTLKLILVPHDMDITPTQAELKMAVVYIFDRAGNVSYTWTKQNPALNTSYDTGILLGDDTYRLVGWLNPQAPYTITPAFIPTPEPLPTRAPFDDGRVTLDVPADGNVTEMLPPLLYGSTMDVTAPVEDYDVEIPLTLDTYHVSVTQDGIPQDGSVYRAILWRVIPVLVVPFVAALTLRKLAPRIAGAVKRLGPVSFYLWVAALTIVTARIVNFVATQTGLTLAKGLALAATALVLCVLQFAAGRLIGKRWGETIAGGQALGQKNTILAIWLAQSYLNPVSSIAPAAYVLWQNIFNSVQMWRKSRKK